jgi:hypothetical protein
MLTHLVANEASQVAGLGGIITREALDLATSTPAALLRQETQGTAPRVCKQQETSRARGVGVGYSLTGTAL